MQFITDDLDLAHRATVYVMQSATYLPAEVQGKLNNVISRGGPGDKICNLSELLYSHYDLLDAAGKELMANLFAITARKAWVADTARADTVVGVVYRDLGVTTTMPLPAAGEEPEPQVNLREGELNWKSGITATLDQVQARKWDQVKSLRREKELAGADTPIGVVQSDDLSKVKINGLVTMAMIANLNQQPFDESFTLADNSIVALDATTAITMGVAVAQHVSAAHARARQLRDEIYAADATVDSVQAIDITTGWPEPTAPATEPTPAA